MTAKSLELFLAYANDAGEWGGCPLVGGNVGQGKAARGNLTQLKKEGLLTTFESDNLAWVSFTQKGIALAATHGITIEPPF